MLIFSTSLNDCAMQTKLDEYINRELEYYESSSS